MKFLLLAVAIIFFSIEVTAHSFAGNWYFVKGEYQKKDGSISKADNKTLVAVKSVKGNSFALTNTENGIFLGYLAGKFSVEGDFYSEIIEEGTSKKHHGKTFRFKGWLEERQEGNETVIYWHHEGEVNGIKEREVWKKLQ